MVNETSSSDMPISVLHIIGGLQKGGGAEEILYRLILENSRNKHIVMSLQDAGYYGPELVKHGIKVVTIDLSKSPLAIFKLISIYSKIRNISPDVVQTWLYYSDFIGGVFARLAGVRNIVWGIHHSSTEREGSAYSSYLLARLCALVSKYIPRNIISCSKAGAIAHIKAGYAADKFSFVPNGYDLEKFKNTETSIEKSENTNLSLVDEFCLDQNTVRLGMVARFFPIKDHENMFSALSRLSSLSHDNWILFLFGRDLTDNHALYALLNKYGIQDKVIVYGLSTTIAEHIRQLDILVLSSLSEAFPNVLNEAMASKVPCVSTDVGDSKVIVGDCGWIVPVSDSPKLAAAIASALSELQDQPEKWQDRRIRCRQHIEDNFTLERMANDYEAVWRRGISQDDKPNQPTSLAP